MELSGKLIFTCGNGLCSLDLNSLSIKEIIKYKGPMALQTSVSLFDDKVLIDSRGRLKKIDLITGGEQDLFAGEYPYYAATHDYLFFYRWSNENKTRKLVAKKMKAGTELVTLTIYMKPFKINDLFIERVPPVQISDDEVLFIGNDFSLNCYNMATGESVSLGIKNIQPFIYRSKTGQVLCFDYSNIRWLLFSPDDKNTTYIDDPPLFYTPVAYIPDKDIMIYTTDELSPSGLEEISFVMAFDFESGIKKKLIHGQGTFGAVWINE
ncbi:hypothetical protein [Desulfonema ishimotonii]|uniref:hypothetical protein n=1 Tax=Desulfonema ishimotonii TaxID=45657 RepID=UPI000F58B27F|nr:hypothetical protein [Desulfonema ishimotonii]